MHIGFERSTFENDICLLQLSQNVKANPNIAPVCLPQDKMSDNFSGNCFIAGWGVLAENTNTIPTILQEAEVPYVKHDRCQTIFQKVAFFRYTEIYPFRAKTKFYNSADGE